jgi:hypothetical protein
MRPPKASNRSWWKHSIRFRFDQRPRSGHSIDNPRNPATAILAPGSKRKANLDAIYLRKPKAVLCEEPRVVRAKSALVRSGRIPTTRKQWVQLVSLTS